MRKEYIYGILGLAGGILIGVFSLGAVNAAHTSPQTTAFRQSDIVAGQYKFIDPLLGLKNNDTTVAPQYVPLQNSIEGLLQKEEDANRLTAASVTFRDVNVSGGFTLHRNEEYNPASLLKVPTMMTYFKLAEKNPSILSEKITYTSQVDANTQEYFKSATQLQVGTTYTVEELIEHMIKYSDNNAAELLVSHLNDTHNEEALNKLFTDLGLTEIDLQNDFITIQAYTLFFRVLYNATYLSRDMSERALELLSQTDFTSGIVSSISDSTPAAHKFGEFTLKTQSNTILKEELHDCGFVYYPGHTYLLCIMTKGTDFENLERIISIISADVYGFMKKQYPQ